MVEKATVLFPEIPVKKMYLFTTAPLSVRGQNPQENDTVEFSVVQGAKGPQAQDVKVVSE
jgi:hypothetical protein